MAKKEEPPTSHPAPPEEIACGAGYIWSFRKSGSTGSYKTSWDAGTAAEKLVEAFSKATEAAAKEWVKTVKCTGACAAKVDCTKGGIRIGPPEANGDRNTWVPDYSNDYSTCSILVEVTCRARVICYCGDLPPDIKEGSGKLS